jgi:hypothetical protein
MVEITAMGFTLKVETKRLSSLIKRVDAINNTEIEVGFWDDRYGPENDNLPVAQVAAYNNFGTSFNPTRPFMDDTFEDIMYQAYMARGVKNVFLSVLTNGRGTQRLLRELGGTIKELMQVTIQQYAAEGGNSPKTIERKGRDSPLIDTGKMLESVRFIIHKGDM